MSSAERYTSSSSISSSSYRRIFGDSSRISNASVRGTPQFQSTTSSVGMYRRPGRSTSSSFTSSFSSPVPAGSLDLVQTSAANNQLKVIRTNEKEQLQGLNDRFATFIDKVRNLEQQNKVLEAELLGLRQKQGEPSRLASLYQQEMRDLRAQLDDMGRDQNRVLMERDHLEDELQKLSLRCEDQVRARDQAEQTLRSFRKDVDEAAAVRLDLERRVESLTDEISFLKKVHEEELQELMEAQQVQIRPEPDPEPAKPDLTSALKEIRNQYETVASRNLQASEDWYKAKLAGLSEQATRSNEAVRASREELVQFRRQIQSKTLEMETMRGANESLERQIAEMEETHSAEVTAMQDTIGHLDCELRNLKEQMVQHLREYQDLLNVKMALDIEIAAYRKLLEGEETHFNSAASFGATSFGYQSRPLIGQSGSTFSVRRDKNGVQKETVPEPEGDEDQGDINSN